MNYIQSWISNIGVDIQNWIQVILENHLLRVEYLKLLGIGAFIGCLLFISMIFIMESNQIKRTVFLSKNIGIFLEILLTIGTSITLILIFFNTKVIAVSIIFVCYLFFAHAMNRARNYYYEKTRPNTKYQKQII